jgi:tetratricopeptide (TPR) repeat protein
MNFDPDLKECQQVIKMLKKATTMKDEAAVIFKDGKYEEAIVKFEECLQLDELNANYNSTILLNIAISYSKLNKNDLALKALNKAILYNPKYAKAYVKRGEIHL